MFKFVFNLAGAYPESCSKRHLIALGIFLLRLFGYQLSLNRPFHSDSESQHRLIYNFAILQHSAPKRRSYALNPSRL